jgi:hypothetical protein
MQDLAGNALVSSPTAFFTTEVAPDVTPPEVVMVTPDDGATDVTRTQPITVTFSEPINAATVNNTNFILTAATTLSKTLSRSADNTVVTMSLTMPASTTISLQLTSGVTDFAGNPLAGFASSFTTSSLIDTIRPSISVMRPGGGSTRVAADTTVVLYASEALDPASLDAGVFISADGVLVSGTISLAAGVGTIEFVPDAPFAPNANVQVFATTAIQDLEGNALFGFFDVFRIVPDTATENAFIEDMSPASGATNVATNTVLEVRYSEPLDPAQVNAVNVRVSGLGDLGGLVERTGTRSLIDGGRTIRFVPDVSLDANRFHSWRVTSQGLDDAAARFSLSASFTTGDAEDAVAPTVVSISPPDEAVDVGVTTVITVVFDEPVNPLSVTGSTIAVAGPSGDLIPCTISFSNSDQTAIITPHSPLQDTALYTVTVDGVTDVAGNPVTPDASEFTTRVGL